MQYPYDYLDNYAIVMIMLCYTPGMNSLALLDIRVGKKAGLATPD